MEKCLAQWIAKKLKYKKIQKAPRNKSLACGQLLINNREQHCDHLCLDTWWRGEKYLLNLCVCIWKWQTNKQTNIKARSGKDMKNIAWKFILTYYYLKTKSYKFGYFENWNYFQTLQVLSTLGSYFTLQKNVICLFMSTELHWTLSMYKELYWDLQVPILKLYWEQRAISSNKWGF